MAMMDYAWYQTSGPSSNNQTDLEIIKDDLILNNELNLYRYQFIIWWFINSIKNYSFYSDILKFLFYLFCL